MNSLDNFYPYSNINRTLNPKKASHIPPLYLFLVLGRKLAVYLWDCICVFWPYNSVAILPRVRLGNTLWWIPSEAVSLTPSPEAVHFCHHMAPIIWGLLTPLTADMRPHVWWNVSYEWISAKEMYGGLVQGCSISSVLVLGISQYCTKPTIDGWSCANGLWFQNICTDLQMTWYENFQKLFIDQNVCWSKHNYQSIQSRS